MVCGIKQTDIRFFIASTTVRLIPSTAIEPFSTIYRTSCFGMSNQILISFGFFSIFLIIGAKMKYVKQLIEKGVVELAKYR